MKKIMLSVCALSAMVFTSCSNEVDMFETIGTPKGTLNVDCIYDTEMTRATATESWSWIIKAGNTPLKQGDNYIAEGTYTVTASNYDNLDKALEANDNWGDAFYSGSQPNVVVTKGNSTLVSIDCGRAQNARLKAEFKNLISKFTNVALVADVTTTDPTHEGRNLMFTQENASTKRAYFKESATITCKLSYDYNGTHKEKTINFTLAGAATENVITVNTNENGTITISLTNITYDDAFGTGNSNIITIDAATGAIDKVVTTPSAN